MPGKYIEYDPETLGSWSEGDRGGTMPLLLGLLKLDPQGRRLSKKLVSLDVGLDMPAAPK